MGWGGFLDKVMDKIPIQGRVERWKNKLDKLEAEREALIGGSWTHEKATRLDAVKLGIAKYNGLLKNKAGN